MTKVSLNHVFFGLIAHHPSHGYRLLDHFQDDNRLATVWNLSTSQLYSTLKQLETAHLIDGREEFTLDAPNRIVYRITETGQQQLDAWLNEPHPSASTRAIRTEFLSRLYICRLLKRPTETIIMAQKASCEVHRLDLIQQRDQLAQGAGYLSVDLRVREMSVIMDWLEIAETMFATIRT